MRKALVLGLQLGPLVRPRRQLVELADLPGQALALALQRVARRARPLERRQRRAPGLPALGQARRVDAGFAVEQRTDRGRPRQALPGVLAVDVDQVLGQLSQLRDGGRAAVDPGAAAPLHVDRAPQQQRALAGLEAALLQPGQERRRQVELRAHLGALRTLAHQARFGTAAQRQLQRLDEDGLAGTRLAGEHGEAGLQRELELAHEDDVAKGEAAQHGATRAR